MIILKPYIRDQWNRQLYKSVATGTIFIDPADVEENDVAPKFSGKIYSLTRQGEPNMPMKTDIKIIDETK